MQNKRGNQRFPNCPFEAKQMNKRGNQKFSMINQMNKRGQGLSTNAIILIILGVLVLAILIVGFTMGWKALAIWLPKDNVDDMVTFCEVACATQNVYDYCSRERELKADDLPDNQKEVTGNCTFFATDESYLKYGIKECLGLCS